MIDTTNEFTEDEVNTFLIMNAIFGFIFVFGMFGTIMMILQRDINDLFMSRSLYCMIGALTVTIGMCFYIWNQEPDIFLNKQTETIQ